LWATVRNLPARRAGSDAAGAGHDWRSDCGKRDRADRGVPARALMDIIRMLRWAGKSTFGSADGSSRQARELRARFDAPSSVPSRACRRHPNTCCEQTCHRRATSDTRAPGTSVSATIRAFSSADQRRRRPGPGQDLNAPKAGLRVIINVDHTTARSSSPPAHPAYSPAQQKNGHGSGIPAFLARHKRIDQPKGQS
jgi:hypothetical protein